MAQRPPPPIHPVTMRKPIEVRSRVAARRGPYEAPAPGRVRQQRAFKFGNVEESVANNKFRIRWDDGTESLETSNVLKLQPDGAGALPQVCPPYHPTLV